MGQQIIRQPNGKLGVFSSVTDTVIVWDADASEIEQFFVDQAAEAERRRVQQIIGHVVGGHPEKAYYQFALTWDEALEMDRIRGGEVWNDPAARSGDGE